MRKQAYPNIAIWGQPINYSLPASAKAYIPKPWPTIKDENLVCSVVRLIASTALSLHFSKISGETDKKTQSRKATVFRQNNKYTHMYILYYFTY